MTVVLDASAVLAVIQGEAGSDAIEMRLGEAVISTVNLSEVAAKLVDRGLSQSEVMDVLDALALETEPFSVLDALRAGELRRVTAAVGLSLGDRACLALANRLGVRAITTDRVWSRLAIGVDIEVARPAS